MFVGPSGCGKSTLLRLIAGLEDVTGGRIEIDGEDATRTPPAKRGLAMVFQSYALYPHMSVRKNIAFPLKMANIDKAEVTRRVDAAAKVLNLTDYLDRRPGQLSGGQRQRVAIGRAIVRQPAAFLFDEPLSNLDAALRVNMRLEISELHHKLKTTMVYVTHDQVEAMTMADKIVVLNAGRIEQVGSPLELYHSPRNQDELLRRRRRRKTWCVQHRCAPRASEVVDLRGTLVRDCHGLRAPGLGHVFVYRYGRRQHRYRACRRRVSGAPRRSGMAGAGRGQNPSLQLRGTHSLSECLKGETALISGAARTAAEIGVAVRAVHRDITRQESIDRRRRGRG